jgi:hypothetical protein
MSASINQGHIMSNIAKLALKAALAISSALVVAASASATVLTTKISVDNSYVAYLASTDNSVGTQFVSGNDWSVPTTGTITLGTAAQYFLHIDASDAGGVAGMIGQFSLTGSGYHFANGLTTLATGSSLITGNATGFNGVYSAVSNYGTNGVAPWSTQSAYAADSKWIWVGNNDTNNRSYFSVSILADAPASVPEPTSLALTALGLLALTRLRAKQK